MEINSRWNSLIYLLLILKKKAPKSRIYIISHINTWFGCWALKEPLSLGFLNKKLLSLWYKAFVLQLSMHVKSPCRSSCNSPAWEVYFECLIRKWMVKILWSKTSLLLSLICKYFSFAIDPLYWNLKERGGKVFHT